MLNLLFFVIALSASTLGAISGIGGGVIIKPALDSFHVMPVTTISFLSGCTVLSMSMYSSIHSIVTKEHGLELKVTLPLGMGAVIGGAIGKTAFRRISTMSPNAELVGAVQSACMVVLIFLVILYTIFERGIQTQRVKNSVVIVLIGITMGIISSFLGIGGGPINLVVLSYFFSFEIKTCALNSLSIILLSQLSSLTTTLITGSVPSFQPIVLILMIAGGLLGGIIGRSIHKHMRSKTIHILYIATMLVIAFLSMRNLYSFLG